RLPDRRRVAVLEVVADQPRITGLRVEAFSQILKEYRNKHRTYRHAHNRQTASRLRLARHCSDIACCHVDLVRLDALQTKEFQQRTSKSRTHSENRARRRSDFVRAGPCCTKSGTDISESDYGRERIP